MTRKNTEIRISRISHGNKAEEEALPRNDTEKHGNKNKQNKPRKQNTAIRAGCVSEGINILFGKGPFDRLRDRGSFGRVSELIELAVKLRDREILVVCLHLP